MPSPSWATPENQARLQQPNATTVIWKLMNGQLLTPEENVLYQTMTGAEVDAFRSTLQEMRESAAAQSATSYEQQLGMAYAAARGLGAPQPVGAGAVDPTALYKQQMDESEARLRKASVATLIAGADTRQVVNCPHVRWEIRGSDTAGMGYCFDCRQTVPMSNLLLLTIERVETLRRRISEMDSSLVAEIRRFEECLRMVYSSVGSPTPPRGSRPPAEPPSTERGERRPQLDEDAAE